MENTYLSAVLPLVIGKCRTVKLDSTPNNQDSSISGLDSIISDSSNPQVIQQMKAVVRSVAGDRLQWEGPCYSVKELIAGPRTVKAFGIKDPRLDMGFGIRKPELDLHPAKVSGSTKNLVHAPNPLDHCFYVMEDKGPDAPSQHRETQAMRGGASLVKVNVKLRSRAGYAPSGIGADSESFVFSCAWEHGYANVYVNWQETLPEGQVTHMTWLDSYALLKDRDIKQFLPRST